MEKKNKSSLEEFKQKYSEIQKKYSLPSFDEIPKPTIALKEMMK